MHTITPAEGNLIRVTVSEKLTQEHYDIPAWEQTIARHGSMRMLMLMEDFSGWEAGAWDDLRFEVTHASQVERVAMVGEKTWQKWMIKIGSAFASDHVKYFDHAQLAEAERWVKN
ncbi:MAG: STAS/SEC14 domain-containing protein [Chthoniobacterales bacterium]